MVQDNTQRVALIEDNVPEARGLDMMPTTVSRLRSGGDSVTANLLEVIHQDEITHVTAGMKWFKFFCEHSNPPLVRVLHPC